MKYQVIFGFIVFFSVLPIRAMWHYEPTVIGLGDQVVAYQQQPGVTGMKSAALTAESIQKIKKFLDQALVKRKLMTPEAANAFLQHCTMYGKGFWLESPTIKDAVLWMMVNTYNKGWCQATAIEKFLKTHKANPNMVNFFGISLLRVALSHKYFDIAKIILEDGRTDPNLPMQFDGSTVLHFLAEFHGKTGTHAHYPGQEGIELLLNHKDSDPLRENYQLLTPVMLAITKHNFNFMKLLLYNQFELDNESKPIWYDEVIRPAIVTLTIEQGDALIMQLLLDAGACVDESSYDYACTLNKDAIAQQIRAHLDKIDHKLSYTILQELPFFPEQE